MYYKYKVSYYNSYDDKEEQDEGLVCGRDYGEAANRVVKDYGTDVEDIFLSEIFLDCEGDCLNLEEIKYAFNLD